MFSGKHIKRKRNPKFKYKYLGPFAILKAVKKLVYKLKLLTKLCIYPVFHVLLLERDITRKKTVDQQITDQLEFEEEEQSKLSG